MCDLMCGDEHDEHLCVNCMAPHVPVDPKKLKRRKEREQRKKELEYLLIIAELHALPGWTYGGSKVLTTGKEILLAEWVGTPDQYYAIWSASGWKQLKEHAESGVFGEAA
jgi:hypothetical protein